jgi:outer membrane protein OmpA-like peptidoglycan-associated protein
LFTVEEKFMKSRTKAAAAALVFATGMLAQTPPPAKKAESAKPAAGRRRPAAAPGQRFRIDYVQTNQTKNDWEEINFEFNSAILSDGFPTLLWLADYLKGHQGYHVKIVGNTDYVGSNAYNNELAIARAESVAAFLRKYGASGNQLTTSGEGKRVPEVSNGTKEGRFVNRRVQLTVTDPNGRAMSLEDLIRGEAGGKEPGPGPGPGGPNCCAEILKRLDDLAGLIRGLKDNEDAEHAKLRNEIADLRNAFNNMPKPLTRQQTQEVANTAADNAVNKAEADFKRNNRKFSLLGLNVGPAFGKNGKPGDFSVSARGQFFSPFGGEGNHAVQANGEYIFYPGLHEGQFDIGLVNRWNNFQAGAFGSFKYIDFSQYQHGGGLGQASVLFDYIFKSGRIGIYGSKGFKDEAVLNSQTIAPGAFLQTYARLVDQAGGTGLVGLWGDSWLQGNIGYLKSRAPGFKDKPGFTIKFVQPLSSEFAFTVEGGLNETLVSNNNYGRLMFGLQWGNFIRPKDYGNTKNPVPMDVPRIRYNILTRQVGATPPVADAGPDQIGVRPGTITLNGSGSYDPLGLALTYKWQQIGGTNVTINNSTAAIANFTAGEGQTYVFRLTVTNTSGLSASARTTVSTITIPNVNINRFDANPPTIVTGQCSIISWDVANAETITITPGVTTNNRPQGTAQVCPTATTTYTLTGTNATNSKQSTASITVTVNAVPAVSASILRFEAVPINIIRGESSTLQWATANAVTVTLNGQSVQPQGSMVVSPTQTTTYTLVATGTDGKPVNATAVVAVTAGDVPRIIQFGLNPSTINVGGQSQLCWQVENATSVSISPGIGTVDAAGCRTVNPSVTTSYVLTATNASGSVTASATLTVGSVKILTFTNDPPFSPISGGPVNLTWTTSGAVSVTITGLGVPSGTLPVNGTITVNPTTNSDYTLTAYGPDGQAVSAVLHVFVR